MVKMNTNNEAPEYPSIPLAQTMVQFCRAKNIRHVIISPGSRNAPLTKGFTGDVFFQTFSIIDERSAAFFALGIAQQIKQPVAVVCTSGSALLNYYPAVAEAYYSDIPLVVLSADRMPHRIDIGDGQTIRQTEVFEPHLEDAAYLTPDVSHATETLLTHPHQELLKKDASKEELSRRQAEIQIENEQAINRVLNAAIHRCGPVHINLPFEEPLYDTTSSILELSHCSLENDESKEIDFAAYSDRWHSNPKKMILVGVLAPHSLEAKTVEYLAADPSVTVLTEVTSNLQHYTFIQSIDTFIAPLEKSGINLEEFQPDLLVTIGGMIVSKKIKAFLRTYSPKNHWHIDPKKAYDTFYCLSEHIQANANVFFAFLQAQQKAYVESSYCTHFLAQYNAHRLQGLDYLKNIPFSDLKAFELISRALPNDVALQLANSSTIRYAQLFPFIAGGGINCNRGTSGIDGSTSTAVGAAFVQAQPTVFITGDLSFFYDANALWNAYLKPSMRIIVINNHGGGIFRILPGEKDTPAYDTYFETVQQRSARQICRDHGIGYRKATSTLGLKWKLKRFFSSHNCPQLLEIVTPRKLNDRILLNYFETMREGYD